MMNPNTETNPSAPPPLSEKDFIRNGWSLTSLPFWLWIFLITIVASLILGSSDWYKQFWQSEKKRDPFLAVTNREFSLFLWQFPSFMRTNTSQKTAYLPGFLTTGENFDPKTAEDFVSAPPDVLFLYHTWKRLLASEFIARSMSPKEFEDFLEQLPEWKPANWVKAPPEYIKWIDSKSYSEMKDLQSLPLSTLPLMVRQAFIGWKNYFMEGPQINDVKPTFAQMQAFLDKHPRYARNYWRNIQEIDHQKVAGLDYLSSFVHGNFVPEANIPKEELAPFLKVAFYNGQQNYTGPSFPIP